MVERVMVTLRLTCDAFYVEVRGMLRSAAYQRLFGLS
jgi:hypothetical protein